MWLKKKPLFSPLKKKLHKNWGRNNTGKITARHRGGGFKPKVHLLDYDRFIWNVPAIVRSLEKNASKNCYVSLLIYPFGLTTYVVSPAGLRPGNTVIAGDSVRIVPGNCTYLKNIPLNTKIHNVESHPTGGAKLARSAGSFATLIEKNAKDALVRFSSGKVLRLSLFCSATIGRVSNLFWRLQAKKNKAGQNRNLNKRPKVRGVVQNPVDHPHGGGKGKKSPKQPNYNFKRLLPKGRKTSRSIRLIS